MNGITNAFTDKANLMWGAVVSVLTMFFGAYWYIFLFFFALNIVDFITGMRKAKKTETLTSKRGAEGVYKKVGYWIIIALAFGASSIIVEMGKTVGLNLGFISAIGWFTLATLLLNEMTSVSENLIVLGVNVPPILTRGLAVVKTAVDEAGNKVIPEAKQEEKKE